MSSPYQGQPSNRWAEITQRLISKHPLTPDVLLDASLSAWKTLWKTKVGAGRTSVSLEVLNVPAAVIGYFFQVLLARELQNRLPGEWRGGASKDEKDLVYIPDPMLSVELKTSGQLGYRVYGNRSYGQESTNDALVKKEKSGYYVTVNFYGKVLTLLRFGWIDAEDWKPQSAPTGQMAGLSDEVYRLKLAAIPGAYRSQGPVELLLGIGPALANELQALGVRTIGDLLAREQSLSAKFRRIVEQNSELLDGCRPPSE